MNASTLVQKLWNYCNQPSPDVIAQEIVDDLEAALEQFREVLADLRPDAA